MRRLWQSMMISLARRDGLTRFVQSWRATSGLTRRFVAGRTVETAAQRARQLFDDKGLRASLFYLGEYVTDPGVIAQTLTQKIAASAALVQAGLDVHVSVDSTQIGQMIDTGVTRENAARIVRGFKNNQQGGTVDAARVNVLMFDMEDASVIDDTIALHDGFASQGDRVALTLQAYLKRTEVDLQRQIARGAKVRLVKGAFIAGDDIAFTARADIKANYRRLVERMFSPAARATGFYPIIATHDERIQAYALEKARLGGWGPDEFEFEMLLGVRSNVAERLAADGWRVRLYTPFGVDWWPYAIRRIGENPANAVLLARSLVS